MDRLLIQLFLRSEPDSASAENHALSWQRNTHKALGAAGQPIDQIELWRMGSKRLPKDSQSV